MNNVILIGMPGCGKSTLGVLLAKSLGMTFLDTDLVIQDREHALLSELIRTHGSDGFLALEESICAQLDVNNSVIATGGSVVYRERCMRHLQGLGPVVHLDAPLEIVEERIARNPQRGLAIAPGQSIADIFHEREPLYQRYCSLRCVTHPYTPAQCVRWILAHLDVGALSERA